MGASYLYTIEFHKHSTLHPPVSVIIKHWKRWRLIKGLFHYRILEVLVVARATYVVCLKKGEGACSLYSYPLLLLFARTT